MYLTRFIRTSHITIALVAALALSLVGQQARAETEMLDRVVAIVGDDVVLESELENRTATIMARLQDSGSQQQVPPREVLEKQILDQLVLERLQMQMGERYGIEVSEQQLDQTIQRIMQNNQLTEQQLAADLARQGQSMASFREQIRRELWVNQIQQAVVNSRIELNEQDIDSFLASTDGKFATSPDYRLGHILISVPGDASSEEVAEAQEQAQEVYRQLVDGADFSQMAMTHSNDANALQGGELGWRKLEQLPTLFADVVSELGVGDVAEPVRSGAGFHILKVHETRSSAGNSMVEQTRARHILVKTSEIVDDAAAERKLRELRERILAGESFADLAREHSEDLGSMLQGGDLGWTMPGQMVPAFDEVMNNTAVGEVSEPFKSRFGWHILTVEERREQDMSERMIRNQAANLLRERRFDEELQTWLAEIREEVYIELKL